MISFQLYTRLPFVSTWSLLYLNNQRKLLNVRPYRQFSIYNSSICERQNICASFLQTYRYMAGHAKWQNVKNVKAEKDRQKGLLYNKYVRQITAAIRDKGPDPKQNNRLANLLEDARRDNVPSSTLESAFKRTSSKKIQVGIIEMLGPGGFMVVFDYETDNISEMRRNVKFICRKYSAGIYPGGGGRWRSAYLQKGIIKVCNQLSGEALESEKMLDAAIEAGAEDVQKSDEEDKVFYEFFCAPEDLNMVKKELEKKFIIEEAYVGYLPVSTVALSDEDKTVALNFLNELGDLPDVSRMYENIE